MMQKYRIAIIGIGAVGGYLGGKLAANYAAGNEIEIIFITRGENEKIIRSSGLKLITADGEQIVYPSVITSKPEDIGFVDLLICCIKSYDLETAMESLKPCINAHTIILPLLNGVDASERIHTLIPYAQVWNGCIYIVSRLIAPGIVKQSGNMSVIYMGTLQAAYKEKLEEVKTIFTSAGINAHVSENILQTLWEKFLFISPLATLTSYLDTCTGEISTNKKYEELLQNLVHELKSIADAKHISLSENILQKILDRIKALPYETTSSMHTDFAKGNKTELSSLTTYVVNLGKELNIPTPYYEMMLNRLKNK